MFATTTHGNILFTKKRRVVMKYIVFFECDGLVFKQIDDVTEAEGLAIVENLRVEGFTAWMQEM